MVFKYFNKKDNSDILFSELVFTKHIFNEEKTISPRLFYFSFSEFGCEAITPTFLIPRINNNFKQYRKIVVGWHGREYFYRNVCDEYWELNSKYMVLKNNSYAFENKSSEIQSLYKRLSSLGIIIGGNKMGNLCINCKCQECSHEFARDRGDINCINCGSNRVIKSLLQGCKEYKNNIFDLPEIQKEYNCIAERIIPEKTVALFARNRKTYNRNLSANHYDEIIFFLNEMGYNVVLLGEPVSSHNIKNSKVINFLDSQYAGNLEAAFAVVKRCDFSLQLFTASTRISSLLGKKFVLVESPDQLYGRGQEGRRISLLTKKYDSKKFVVANFYDVVDNFHEFLTILKNAVSDFVFNNNSEDVFLRPNDYVHQQSNLYKDYIW